MDSHDYIEKIYLNEYLAGKASSI